MLCFDIRSLEAQAAIVDAELGADDPVWQEGDPMPEGGVRVRGRLSSAGSGRFYWHGTMEGGVRLTCRRCLGDASARVREDLHLIFAERGDEETEGADVYELDPRGYELDLRPAIREHWVLAAPGYALCREACKGLCPRCGADLNVAECECPVRTDSRWDGLRKAK